MKTLITSVMIAFFAAFSSASFAQSSNSGSFKSLQTTQTEFVVYALPTGKIDVEMGKSEGQKLFIQVLDNNGVMLASKEIGKNSPATRTRFDMNSLPDGVYKIVVTEGTEKQVKNIVLDTTYSNSFRTINMG